MVEVLTSLWDHNDTAKPEVNTLPERIELSVLAPSSLTQGPAKPMLHEPDKRSQVGSHDALLLSSR